MMTVEDDIGVHIVGQCRRRAGQHGYVMAALLVSMAVMAVMLTVALPTWRQTMQREKEAELVFRGEQYAHAIGLYQRKFAGAFPPSIDVLVQQKFLRKKYKDPMVPDGQFQVLYQSAAGQQPGQAAQPGSATTPGGAATRPGVGGSSSFGRPGASFGGGSGLGSGRSGSSSFGGVASFTPGEVPTASTGTAGGTLGASGGIIGVASKSTKSSLRLYKGRSHYNEWQFLYTEVSSGAGLPGQGLQPGQMPGGLGGVGQGGGASRPGGATGRAPFGGRPGSAFPTTPGGTTRRP